ncbi:hypothetical protein [Maribacter sp. 2308TA10-17]|uniref:hypothetical protein n=1 Tax=Maribacter sp. 2308TA10-17 TaxID=3386276 RepID=UPI0039BD1965
MIKNLILENRILIIILIHILFISCTKNKDSENLPDSEITRIPDSEFERALIALGHDSGPIDGIVLTKNINTIKTLDVSGLFITDLTGIEDFEKLEILNCSENLLSTLDLSKNMVLKDLKCNDNKLSALKLDNPDLINLFCYDNQLTNIDFSSAINLKKLLGGGNLLSQLNLVNNSKLTELVCFKSNVSSVTLSPSVNLESIVFTESNLTKIDLTSSTNLKLIDMTSNKLNELNLSSNLMIESISVHNNELEILDLSNNLNLERLICYSNKLRKINLKNENNNKIDGQGFDAKGNPNLTCVQVDNINSALEKWSNEIDNPESFKTNCF